MKVRKKEINSYLSTSPSPLSFEKESKNRKLKKLTNQMENQTKKQKMKLVYISPLPPLHSFFAKREEKIRN